MDEWQKLVRASQVPKPELRDRQVEAKYKKFSQIIGPVSQRDYDDPLFLKSRNYQNSDQLCIKSDILKVAFDASITAVIFLRPHSSSGSSGSSTGSSISTSTSTSTSSFSSTKYECPWSS